MLATCERCYPSGFATRTSGSSTRSPSRGDVSGVSYEVKRALGDDGRPDIETSLAYSAPGGVQLMADTKGTNVDAVSAFHTAGPFNVQPSWLVPDAHAASDARPRPRRLPAAHSP